MLLKLPETRLRSLQSRGNNSACLLGLMQEEKMMPAKRLAGTL